MDKKDRELLSKLKIMREGVNWEVEKERREFLHRLYPIISTYNSRVCYRKKVLRHRDIFRLEEIDWLLIEDVKNNSQGGSLVKFFVDTGYKDQPEVDADGKPSSCRTTPIHHAAGRCLTEKDDLVSKLFEIYDRFDVNYVAESGLTHFHVACMYNLSLVIEKFLKLGQDPNCIVPDTLDTPLHLALTSRNLKLIDSLNKHREILVNVVFRDVNSHYCHEVLLGEPFLERKVYDEYKSLLRYGANPNLANDDGLTPLHFICTSVQEDEFVKLFFEIVKEKHQPLEVDAKDRLGRTPLQLAVVYLLPNTVDFLLDHGADVSNFVFPTESDFDCEWIFLFQGYSFRLRLGYGLLSIVNSLEKRGYKLDQSDVSTIMKIFITNDWFKKLADFEKGWSGKAKKMIITKAKKMIIKPDRFWDNDGDDAEKEREPEKSSKRPSLSFYDLIRLRPKEIRKRIKYTQFFELMRWEELQELPKNYREACLLHLCMIISRGFFRRYALDSFLELTDYQLPILCCEKIIEMLMNEDLCRICLAVMDQSDP